MASPRTTWSSFVPAPRVMRAVERVWLVAVGSLLAASAYAVAQEPPMVVELSPPQGALDVDAKQVKQIMVTFDRAMLQGQSLCGGGANAPKGANPRWKNAKTWVMDVDLEPDHDYRVMVNCPAAQNFRSAAGVPAASLPWSFSTLPEELPPQKEQRARNRKANDAMWQLLREKYSYYDLRLSEQDWAKLRARHDKELANAKTDVVWAGTAARMLAAAQDIHMVLRVGERTFGTGSRAVDPLFRMPLLRRYFETRALGDNAIVGRNEDGIGYLMLGAWTKAMDVDAVEKALADLRDTQALVVDVRPNSGGDEGLARRIAAWFVDGTRTYAKNRYRTGAGKNGFGPVYDRQVTGNREPAKQYRKPIAVLTSRYVMSSNESFVMMLRQAPDCTVVGQPTFGSSGNPKAHELVNGVTLVMPSWQDLRLDGTCLEGQGLAPDEEVAADADALRERDPILERALEVLRAKVKSPKSRGDRG